MVTTNLPFDEWTTVFGSQRLAGALLDRLTHHVHILEMNGDSYRVRNSQGNAARHPPKRNKNFQLTRISLHPPEITLPCFPQSLSSSGRWDTLSPPMKVGNPSFWVARGIETALH